MNYQESDSSGTDDDLPPSHQNIFSRGGRASGNGRSAVSGSTQFQRSHNDLETHIHVIEQEAYSGLLRAFKAQSDALSWEKESLITELRKELRVSDDEHRELLSKVNADDTIRRIREWRKSGGTGIPLHEPLPSPTVSVSRKKQKTSQSNASLPFAAPSPAFHPSMPTSSSALKRGPPSGGARGKKSKAPPLVGATGRGPAMHRSSSGTFMANEPVEGQAFNSLVGRKVWTRWPEDNHFYEAVITDFNPHEGRHALVYDKGTTDETWEWVNLKEISPEDIRWESEDHGMSRKGGHPGTGRGVKKCMTRGGGVTGGGRGRGTAKGQSKKDFPSQNGIEKKASGDIKLMHTDILIKEVEKIFGVSHPDPLEIEKARKVLEDQEHALIDAIAKLENISDSESDGERP